MAFPLDDLQNKLGYTFKHIQLLHEALTHDFDDKSKKWDIFNDRNVFYKKRKLHRLKLVGVSVLKLVSAEKAIVSENYNKSIYTLKEGYLTRTSQFFTSENYFQDIVDGLCLWKYIHTRNCVNPRQISIQQEVIQAIYGAVFIDAGGCESENLLALNSVRNLFDLLYHKYFSNGNTCIDSRRIYFCFRVNHFDVKTWLISKKHAEGEHIEPYSILEKKIGYNFNEADIIKTALTHDSVKCFNSNFSNYEVLEFLGDAVYQLVICEYLFWHYINDVNGKFFNYETLKKFVSKQFQIVIANNLELKRFIIKPSHVIVYDTHDFLESIVGAIFIDSQSLRTVKNVLVQLCRKFEKETVDSCNTRLPFALRTYYGSWHYKQDEKLKDKILEEHELPPKRQDIFKIISYAKLYPRLDKNNDSKNRNGTIQSCDSKAKIVESESWCNQQEFGRVGLHQSWIRMLYLPNFEYDHNIQMSRWIDHTYNEFSGIDSITPEYTLNSNLKVPESKIPNKSNNEPTFKDVCSAASVIGVWIMNWVVFILRTLFKLVINIVEIMTCLLFSFIILMTVLEYFGFVEKVKIS